MFEFPENLLGIKRGTILEAIHPVVSQLGMKVGDKLVVGFDGAYVRCMGFTWSIDQLVEEIEMGVWKMIGVFDLSDPVKKIFFTRFVERREMVEENS